MASLMTGSYRYSELIKKYQNFFTPAFKIKINGKDIAANFKFRAENISVTLSLDSPSSVSFDVVNVYDLEKRNYISNVANTLKLGNQLSIELGYGSSLTGVFIGYIHEVRAEFHDIPILRITALDVRRLMMDFSVVHMSHQVKSVSQAFKLVMGKYSKLCKIPATNIDDTENNIKEVVQNGNDFDFIMRKLCKDGDREFFVLNGEAYFRKSKKTTTPITTLEWGNSLMSFSKNALYRDISFKIIGYDGLEKNLVVGQAISKTDKSMSMALGKHQSKTMKAPYANDMKKVKTIATQEADEAKERSQQGSGSCIGLPIIVPGRYVKVAKLAKEIDGEYYIKQVQHSFGTDGFSTNFEIGGWK